MNAPAPHVAHSGYQRWQEDDDQAQHAGHAKRAYPRP
jgi:hypothetical protein